MKMYEKELGKNLLGGLIELGKTEKIIDAIFSPDNVEELGKRIASALLIIVDNRNKILKMVVDLSNKKI